MGLGAVVGKVLWVSLMIDVAKVRRHVCISRGGGLDWGRCNRGGVLDFLRCRCGVGVGVMFGP